MLVLPVVLIAPGCAEMPSETITYYFPQAETNLVVTETVGCDAKNTMLVSASTVVATTSYSRAPKKTAQIDFSKYGGDFSDADLALNLTNDGRLSGINSTTSGGGSATLKSAATLATAVVAATALFEEPENPGPTAQQIKDACTQIAKYAGARSADQSGKLATITYTVNLLYSDDASQFSVDEDNNPDGDKVGKDGKILLQPDPDGETLYKKMPLLKDKYSVALSPSTDPWNGAVWANHSQRNAGQDEKDAPYGYVPIELNQTKSAQLQVSGPDAKFSTSKAIWAGPVSVPIATYYPLLVPSGTLFGSQGFTLSLFDDGSVTKLEYSTKSGASDIMDSGSAIVGAVPNASTEAAATQAKADLIYQQQRLVTCKTTPAACTQ